MLVNLNFKMVNIDNLSAVETRYCLMQYLLFEWIKTTKLESWDCLISKVTCSVLSVGSLSVSSTLVVKNGLVLHDKLKTEAAIVMRIFSDHVLWSAVNLHPKARGHSRAETPNWPTEDT